MITAAVLCVMAIVDGALGGFRAWAGRDGRVVKRDERMRSARLGALGAAFALVAIATVLLLILATAAVTFDELVGAGNRMLAVYVPFCAAVTLGFLGYFSPSLEWQALSTVVVLGPATLARPFIMLAGALAAGWGASTWVLIGAFTAVLAMMVVEAVLSRHFARELADHPF